MIRVNAKELKEAIQFVKGCLSKDERRPLLNYIHLKEKDTQLIVEALDGFRLARTSVKILSTNQDKTFEALVEPFPITADDRELFAVSLETDERYLIVTEQTGEKHSHIMGKGDYTKTDPILDGLGEPNFVIYFDPRMIADAAKKFKVTKYLRPMMVMEFHGEMAPCIIRNGTNGTKIQMVLPLRH